MNEYVAGKHDVQWQCSGSLHQSSWSFRTDQVIDFSLIGLICERASELVSSQSALTVAFGRSSGSCVFLWKSSEFYLQYIECVTNHSVIIRWNHLSIRIVNNSCSFEGQICMVLSRVELFEWCLRRREATHAMFLPLIFSNIPAPDNFYTYRFKTICRLDLIWCAIITRNQTEGT